MKKRILETIIVIIFTILMLLYAKNYDEVQNIIRKNNQNVIIYRKQIGLYEKETKKIIAEQYKPIQTSYLLELKTVQKTSSIQKYKLRTKQPISLENLKINNNYTEKLNKTINEYGDTFNEKYQNHIIQLEKKRLEQERLNSLKNGFVKTQGNITLSNLDLLYQQYNKIPENVRKTFENNGWTLYLTTNKLGPLYYSGQNMQIQGITDFFPKTIYIENRQKACLNATVHEVGHAIDSICGKGTTFGFISYSNEFREIYLEESSNFIEIGGNGEHAKSSPMEYFAEAFNQTILNPESCKKHTPKTYAYIINIINNL